MNKKIIGITLLILMCFLTSIQVYANSQLYEYYITGYDTDQPIGSSTWGAQTFTVGIVSHTITSVKLNVYKDGNPGTITVSIKAVDINGKPTGNDLTSGTYDGNSLTGYPGQWITINLTEYVLSASTMYAIVIRSNGNYFRLQVDWSSPSYSGGAYQHSTNSGVSWTTLTTGDFLFEVYGNLPTISITITSSPTGSGYVIVDNIGITTPHIYAWNIEDNHIIAANSPANLINGESQYIYVNWSDSGTQSHNYTVTAEATITANFQLQYYLTVTGDNSPTGEGWYNSDVNTTSSNPWIWSVSNNTRIALVNWSLDSFNQNPARQNIGTFTTPNITMSTYHTANFISNTQYYLTLTSTISDIPLNQTGSQTSDNWYDNNTNSTISATTPYNLGDITFTFNHWFWSTGGVTQSNSTNNPFNITMDNYASANAYWMVPIFGVDINIDGNATITVDGILITTPDTLHFNDGSTHDIISLYYGSFINPILNIIGNATIILDGLPVITPDSFDFISNSNHTLLAYWSYPASPSDNIGFLIILTVGVLVGILLMSRK